MKLGQMPNQQDQTSADELISRITSMMQSQFGLKPKEQLSLYQCPYQAWYDIVALLPRYRVPDLSKFTGLDAAY